MPRSSKKTPSSKKYQKLDLNDLPDVVTEKNVKQEEKKKQGYPVYSDDSSSHEESSESEEEMEIDRMTEEELISNIKNKFVPESFKVAFREKLLEKFNKTVEVEKKPSKINKIKIDRSKNRRLRKEAEDKRLLESPAESSKPDSKITKNEFKDPFEIFDTLEETKGQYEMQIKRNQQKDYQLIQNFLEMKRRNIEKNKEKLKLQNELLKKTRDLKSQTKLMLGVENETQNIIMKIYMLNNDTLKLRQKIKDIQHQLVINTAMKRDLEALRIKVSIYSERISEISKKLTENKNKRIETLMVQIKKEQEHNYRMLEMIQMEIEIKEMNKILEIKRNKEKYKEIVKVLDDEEFVPKMKLSRFEKKAIAKGYKGELLDEIKKHYLNHDFTKPGMFTQSLNFYLPEPRTMSGFMIFCEATHFHY